MAKKPISVYPDDETREAIEQYAKRETRPVAQAVIVLVKKGLAAERSVDAAA